MDGPLDGVGRNDGAAALLLMSEEKAKALGLKPMARILSSAAAGVPPRTMGLGPVPAVKKVVARAGLQLKDIGLVELNEAFAIQSLAVIEDLGLDPQIVNVNGGAIALGHPFGATGGRMILTTLNELGRRNQNFGLVTICAAGGLGTAVVLERN